jgi:hypothetical protein
MLKINTSGKLQGQGWNGSYYPWWLCGNSGSMLDYWWIIPERVINESFLDIN